MPSGKGATLTSVQVAATGSASSAVSQNLARVMLILSNAGTSAAFVGSASSVSATNGLSVPAGSVLYLDNYTGPVWVITGGSAVTLGALEY